MLLKKRPLLKKIIGFVQGIQMTVSNEKKNSLTRLFKAYPEKNEMTYFSHMKFSLSISMKLLKGSAILVVHSVFPFLFEWNGSQIIKDLHNKITGMKK